MKRPRKISALIWTAVMFILPTSGLIGQFTYVETFQSTTAEGWVLGSENGSFTPDLTAGGLGIDSNGDGWLRLTTTGNSQANYAYLDNPIPAVGNDISITFDYTVHGGTGADGLAFFMFDADVAFDAGAFGGSLGYANLSEGSTVEDGMAGGYIGLGLDTFGNYSYDNEGRNGGVGFLPDEIVLRGPGSGQSGYDYIAGTGGVNTTDGDAPIASLGVDLQFANRPETGTSTEDNYYTINIFIDPDLLMTVSIDSDLNGSFEELFQADLSGLGSIPDELKLGFTASTGGQTNIHEIRNMEVTTTAQPVGAQFWDSDVNDNWDDTAGPVSNWVSDGQPVDWADIFFGDDYNGGNPNADETVDIETDRNVRSISFDNAYDYTIEDGDSSDGFIMDAPDGGSITINVSEANYTPAGNNTVEHTIEVPIEIEQDLTINNISDSADLVIDGNITTNDNDITVNADGAGLVTLDSEIGGAGGLTKTGSGTLVMNDDNIDFTGDLTIDEGTVEASANKLIVIGRDDANNNFLGAGDVTVNADGTLNVTTTSNDITVDGTFTLNGGTVDFDAARHVELEGTTNINGGTFNMTGGQDVKLNVAGAEVNMTDGEVNITSTGDAFQVKADTTWNQTGGTTNVDGLRTLFQGTTIVDGATMNIDSTNGLFVNGNASSTTQVTNGGVINVANRFRLVRNLDGGDGTGEVIVGGDLSIRSDRATLTNSPNITMDADGVDTSILTTNGSTINGTIGTLKKTGTGTTTIESSVGTGGLDADRIDISGGTLLLGADNQITDTTDLVLSGGTLATGGFSDTLDTLTLTADSTIDMLGDGGVLNFSDSSGISWDAGTLYITNWDGNYNVGGGTDQIFFGAGGLTASQISQIVFVDPAGESGLWGAKLLDSGEIVPIIPEPSTYFGGGLLIGLAGLHYWRRRGKTRG